MKKHTLKISTMSVLCVLCAGLTTNAMAAGSVRALGGNGTYNGTAAASTATRSAPTRAGSLRVSPSSAKLVKSNSSTSGASTSGTAQRLSIGKYLGSNVTTPSGSSSSASAGATAAEINELTERVNALENDIGSDTQVQSLSGRVAAIEDQIDLIEVGGVQGSADGVVVVANDGTVSVDIDALATRLESAGLIASGPKDIRYTDNHELQYRLLTGVDTGWHTWFDLDELEGYTTIAQVNTAINNALATYATKAELDAKANASDVYTKGEVDAAIATGVSGVDLSAYETATHAAATYQPKGTYLTEHQSLAGLATTDDIADMETQTHAAATYQPKGTYLTSTDIADMETQTHAAATYQPKGTYLTEHQSLSAYSTTDEMNAAIAAAALNGEVDLSAYETAAQAEAKYQPKGEYLTAHQDISGKQDALSSAQLAAVDSGVDATKVGQIATNKADIAAIYGAAQVMEENIALKANKNYVDTELGTLSNAVQGKQNKIDAEHPLSANLVDGLATVATTGSYNSLSDKPEIPSIAGLATTEQLNAKADASALADYATTSALTSGLAGKQDTINDLATIIANATLGGTAVQPGDLATVATTGSYNNLSDKPDLSTYVANPTLPTTTGDYMLKLNKEGDTYTYSWAEASTISGGSGSGGSGSGEGGSGSGEGGSGSGEGGSGSGGFEWDDEGW